MPENETCFLNNFHKKSCYPPWIVLKSVYKMRRETGGIYEKVGRCDQESDDAQSI